MTQSVLNTVLDDSFELICGLVAIQTVSASGDEARALKMLSAVTPRAEDLLPRLRGLIKGLAVAQAQAEQVRDLPKARVICAIGQPQPHPHTANSEPSSHEPIIA
ncbi:MAG: hypothetical protein V7672_00855 [Brevundimonas sp.]|uniref:hypothetical protein n=1 Tax=Brevundimonas sp. TaxID=1871086 RepID=UPI0030038360